MIKITHQMFGTPPKPTLVGPSPSIYCLLGWWSINRNWSHAQNIQVACQWTWQFYIHFLVLSRKGKDPHDSWWTLVQKKAWYFFFDRDLLTILLFEWLTIRTKQQIWENFHKRNRALKTLIICQSIIWVVEQEAEHSLNKH